MDSPHHIPCSPYGAAALLAAAVLTPVSVVVPAQ